MRLSSTKMLDRKMLFAAIPSICASSPKKISIYNEEMIVARCFIGFLIFSRKSLGQTFKVTLDGRIQSIQEESQQFPNPNEVVPSESNEQQRLLRISLRICGTVVESLPTARSAPKCEKTVQALLCRNLNVKSATLLNATSSRRIRLQDDIVTGFHFSVSERFVPGCTLKASIVELLREGLVVLRKRCGRTHRSYPVNFFNYWRSERHRVLSIGLGFKSTPSEGSRWIIPHASSYLRAKAKSSADLVQFPLGDFIAVRGISFHRFTGFAEAMPHRFPLAEDGIRYDCASFMIPTDEVRHRTCTKTRLVALVGYGSSSNGTYRSSTWESRLWDLSDALAGVRRSDLLRIGFAAAAVATEELVVFGNAESDRTQAE
ncbi:hypothetical protein IEQ34_024479 [Dendrobium chrysotoxum]|uniref:ATP synthase protein MI25 n=3 Tax=Epidendroideae TaxID=158332 RepID=A0AAV7FRT4_DENCH|nr:hypothetical protein IEQ34_024479 [Dendrobium chrysotoxum]